MLVQPKEGEATMATTDPPWSSTAAVPGLTQECPQEPLLPLIPPAPPRSPLGHRRTHHSRTSSGK